MAFRVLIAGGRHFSDYPRLPAALDALLANRLPDVQFLTGGGRGGRSGCGEVSADVLPTELPRDRREEPRAGRCVQYTDAAKFEKID